MQTIENKKLKTGKQGLLSKLKDNIRAKSVLGILLAIVGAILVYHILSAITVEHGPSSDPEVLSQAGRGLAAIFVAALILWATEAIPIGITSLLMIVLPPILKVVSSINNAAVGYTSPVVFFVIGAYCIAFAVVQSGTGQRFALWLFTRSGTNSKKAVLSTMVGTAVISALVSDVPACAIFMALTLPILAKTNAINPKNAPNFNNKLIFLNSCFWNLLINDNVVAIITLTINLDILSNYPIVRLDGVMI